MSGSERLGPYILKQSDGLPKVSRDSLLLGAFATLHTGDRVFDLGCGVGVLGLCLAGRASGLILDGMDIQPECVRMTEENLTSNGLRGEILQGDVGQIRQLRPGGSYDLVISNPPYFMPGQGKRAGGSRGIARTGSEEGLLSWCRAARWLLRNGGRLALCCRPARLGELITALDDSGLTPKRMQLVQSAPDKAPNLLLMEAMAQGKPGMQILPVNIQR